MAESKEFEATVTSKGQITIPAEIREQLGLGPQDKVIIRITTGKHTEQRVTGEPQPMTLEEAYGSVPPLTQPEDFEALRRVAKEERAERWRNTEQTDNGVH